MSGNTTGLTDLEIEDLCCWVDEFPLSRPKKNLGKDFADGVLVAELIKQYKRDMVDVHNYTVASSRSKMEENWRQLDRKVLKKLGVGVTDEEIRAIITYQPGVLENFLWKLRIKLFRMEWDKKGYRTPRSKPVTERKETDSTSNKPEATQNPGSPRSKASLSLESKKGHLYPNMYPHMYPDTDLMYRYMYNRSELPVIPVTKGSRYLGELNHITRLVYEQKEKEGASLDRNIAFLESKITRLQHLHYIKDMKIEEAERRIQRESYGYLYPWYHDKYIRY